MKKALSGNRDSLHGLAEVLGQAPRVAAAFGKWPPGLRADADHDFGPVRP